MKPRKQAERNKNRFLRFNKMSIFYGIQSTKSDSPLSRAYCSAKFDSPLSETGIVAKFDSPLSGKGMGANLTLRCPGQAHWRCKV